MTNALLRAKRIYIVFFGITFFRALHDVARFACFRLDHGSLASASGALLIPIIGVSAAISGLASATDSARSNRGSIARSRRPALWQRIGTSKTFVNCRLCPASVDMGSKNGSRRWSPLLRSWAEPGTSEAATPSMVATKWKWSADYRRSRPTGRHCKVSVLHVHLGATDARFSCVDLWARRSSIPW